MTIMKFLFACILLFNTLYAQEITRGDTTQKKIALVFTGDEFADGGDFIAQTLKDKKIFQTARVSFDTVEWANEADIDPETLYHEGVAL